MLYLKTLDRGIDFSPFIMEEGHDSDYAYGEGGGVIMTTEGWIEESITTPKHGKVF